MRVGFCERDVCGNTFRETRIMENVNFGGTRMIENAKHNRNDHEKLIDLANVLGTSLSGKSYDLFLKEFAPITYAIFYDDSIATPDGFTAIWAAPTASWEINLKR